MLKGLYDSKKYIIVYKRSLELLGNYKMFDGIGMLMLLRCLIVLSRVCSITRGGSARDIGGFIGETKP